MAESDLEDDEHVGASAKVKLGLGFGVALGAVAVSSFVLFRLMNRMKAQGLENVPVENENVLYCINHNTLIDNFAFESVAYLPKVLFQPEYLPVNLADRKNFFGDPSSRRLKDRVLRVLGKHFFTHLRAYPVDRKRGDLDQVDEWAELLRQNIVVVYPEGTRSRTGEIGTGKPGVGKLIYDARPMVIPVRMIGMEKVLGIGRVVPNVFQTVRMVIGKPMDLSDLLERPVPEERSEEIAFYREISNRVIDAIKALEWTEES
ncbi:MAG TPA: lysophospholipid acyltransferase family protein [Blastocatellia bacterium]|nr:lysophospholipid acyltransferase family protein [Blastocatellia bacterium]